jgi:hypothetical protein
MVLWGPKHGWKSMFGLGGRNFSLLPSRPFIWFSDLVVIKPTVPPAVLIAEAIRSDRATVEPIWNRLMEDESRLQKLYNPELYEKPGFNAQAHYKSRLDILISDTIAQLGPVSKRQTSLICNKISKSILDPKLYYIPDDIRSLINALDADWGIIANHGPQFGQIIGQLAKRESLRLDDDSLNLQHLPRCNALDDGWAKPHAKIFEKAVSQVHRQQGQDVWFVGSSAVVDNNPKALTGFGVKSVLLTNEFETPVSDIDGLTVDQIQQLFSFRIADISELYGAFMGDSYSWLPFDPSEVVHHDVDAGEENKPVDLSRPTKQPGRAPMIHGEKEYAMADIAVHKPCRFSPDGPLRPLSTRPSEP